MPKGIKKFCLLSALASLPIWIILIVYICIDPFNVIWAHHPFFEEGKPNYVGWNKGYVSVEAYEYNNPNQHYDSFIFGSSRSIEYQVNDWRKYIPNNSKIFHFDASMETLKGIYDKMKYIHSQREHINNALIVLDPEMLSRKENKDDYLYVPHSDLTAEWDYLSFQWKFLKVFLTQKFIVSYIDLQFNGFKDYMREENIFTEEYPQYNAIANEETYPRYDNMLAKNSSGFYTPAKVHEFNVKLSNGWDTSPQLTNANKNYLKKIMEELIVNGTNYKIIIPPLYNKQYLNAKDKAILIEIFGADRISDFTGNNEFTNDMHNFYDEKSHPRPVTCRKIMKQAYQND